jgi:hypothetical protein
MHGIPKNLDLSQFKNALLLQICLGEHIVYFKFDSSATIGVEGAWRLIDSEGELIDQSIKDTEKNTDRQYYKLHLLLGKKVLSYIVDSPTSFTLIFEENYELKLIDDSKQYESISIQPGDIFI